MFQSHSFCNRFNFRCEEATYKGPKLYTALSRPQAALCFAARFPCLQLTKISITYIIIYKCIYYFLYCLKICIRLFTNRDSTIIYSSSKFYKSAVIYSDYLSRRQKYKFKRTAPTQPGSKLTTNVAVLAFVMRGLSNC